jgi:hypothetical protein
MRQSPNSRAIQARIDAKGSKNMDVYSFRGLRLLPRRLSRLLGATGLALVTLAVSAGGAAADPPSRCSGSFASPGVLAGTYSSNVTVQGACVVKGVSALIEGNLTVSPGAVLVAAFANSNLTVQGNLTVQHGATLILGCEPSPDAPCLDSKTVGSQGSVSGNLSSQQPLGVVVHNSTIGGNVQETGGGGGFTCNNLGPTVGGFHVFGSFNPPGGGEVPFPVFSDYSDSTINGNVDAIGLNSCYLGVARVHVGGNVHLIDNQLADPDAAEILANQISGNLVCQANSQVWDSHEVNPGSEPPFPRELDRNTVSGNQVGQCVLAGPLTFGGPPAGGAF